MLASFWFTDENIFAMVTPKTLQNDRLYAPAVNNKKDVATKRLRRNNVQSLMASIGEVVNITSLSITESRLVSSTTVTTVPARHMSDLKRVLHLSAEQWPGAQGARGNQLPP